MDLKKPFQMILLCIHTYTPKVSQSEKDVDAERRLHITNRFANNDGPTNALKKIVKIENLLHFIVQFHQFYVL